MKLGAREGRGGAWEVTRTTVAAKWRQGTADSRLQLPAYKKQLPTYTCSWLGLLQSLAELDIFRVTRLS